MPQNNYAETAVTLFGLGLLALGTLAMFVRFLMQHRHSVSSAGRQLVADVKKGEGLTFHRAFTAPANTQATVRHEQKDEAQPRVLRLREWLNLVNHHPDAVPHLFIEGGSGAGKTTLATAVLHDRPGPVAIVGVKPDDGWGNGYTYRSAEREAALKGLLDDVRRRLDDGDKSGLTVVLDDFTRLASDNPAAVQLYKLVADVGRSLRIRLILIARGRQVKGIGASGESDLLEHFVFITVQRGHRASLEYDEETYVLDTERLQDLAQPLPTSRFWTPAPQHRAQDDRAHLSKLLQQSPAPVSVPTSATTPKMTAPEAAGTPVSVGTPHQHASTQDTDDEADTAGIPATLTPEAIQTLYKAWGSKSKIAEMLTGKKQKRLAQIDAALEQETHAETVNAA